jgi:hypothetical protein
MTPQPKPGSGPTPENPEPVQEDPTRDPPVYPEHDQGNRGRKPARQLGREPANDPGAIQDPKPSPDEVVFDENTAAR